MDSLLVRLAGVAAGVMAELVAGLAGVTGVMGVMGVI